MRFSDMYPKDRFYAAEFNGKAVTLTFRETDPVTSELLGKGSSSEKTLPVWHFKETPKKLPAVVTNGVCARAIMQTVLGREAGDESSNWGGHKITLYPAPDPSGLSDDGLCIRVKGSPELERPLEFRAQIGRTKKTFKLLPTGNGNAPAQAPVAPVDPVTGEVGTTAPANQPQDEQGTAENSDDSANATQEPYEPSSAVNAVSDDAGGALFDAAAKSPSEMAADLQAKAEAKARGRVITRRDVTWITTQATISGIGDDELYQWIIDEVGVERPEDIPAVRLDDVKAWIGSRKAEQAAAQ